MGIGAYTFVGWRWEVVGVMPEGFYFLCETGYENDGTRSRTEQVPFFPYRQGIGKSNNHWK